MIKRLSPRFSRENISDDSLLDIWPFECCHKLTSWSSCYLRGKDKDGFPKGGFGI